MNSAVPTTGWGRFKWIGILFLVIVAGVLFFYMFFPRSKTSTTLKNALPLPDRQRAFTKNPVIPDLSANFMTLPSDTYTVSADIYVTGVFENSRIPRILLYRSNTPVHLGVADLAGHDITPFPLISMFPTSNIIVWMDQVTNDIFVSVITAELPDGTPVEVRSAPLSNVPIQSTFRISIILTKHFMELYMNGNLEQTVAFANPPVPVHYSSYFFPPVTPVSASVYLANVSFFNAVLTPKQIQQEARMVAADSFFR